jgi:hypothetical protein
MVEVLYCWLSKTGTPQSEQVEGCLLRLFQKQKYNNGSMNET